MIKDIWFRISVMILLTILITASYVIVVPNPPKALNDKIDSDDNYFAPNPLINRHTRAGTPWPMYLNNPTHTSYTSDTGPTTSDVLWFNSTGGTTYGSPAVVDDKVFVGSRNSALNEDYMNAFYANNGTLAWRTKTLVNVPGGLGVTSSPAIDNGYVFFGGDRFYCLWASNGTIKWTISTTAGSGASWGDGTPTVANGKVFIPGDDRKLYCIEQETGNVLWTFQTQNNGGSNYGLFAPPAVVNGLVYLAACDNNLYQINEVQPTSIATANYFFTMAYHSYSAPVVANGRVFVGCGYTGTGSNNRFYCLDASDLSLIWEFYPGSSTSFFSSAGFYNNRIYIGSVDGNLYCLDAMSSGPTPTEYWRVLIGQTWSSPAITNDRLYIGSRSNYLYCINLSQPATPFYYWRYNTGGDVDSSPAVSDGKVYVGTHGNGGRIYCFGSSITLGVDYIVIEDDSHNELTTVNLNIGESVTAYAAGYNSTTSSFVEYVEVDWTGSGGTWSPGTGTSSTFTAGFSGGLYTQTGQNLILSFSDTFNVNIRPPTLDYIKITNSPNGTELTTVTLPIGETVTAFASGYNSTGPTYVGLYPVDWSGGGGTWLPTNGTSSTFTAGTIGGLYVQIGQNLSLGVSDTFNVNIPPPTLDYILITNSPNGTELSTVTLPIGGAVTAYASGYNSTGPTYIGLYSVDWIGTGGSWFPTIGTSSTFTAGTVGGLYLQTGQNIGLGVSDTFEIDIIDPTLDYILITDSQNGNPLDTVTLPLGGTLTAFASGYNYTGSTYIGLVDVNWSGLGGSWLPSTGTSSIFTAGFTPGLYTLTGENLSLGVSDSFNVDIINYTLDFIVVTDSPNGTPLGTVILPIGGTVTAYASGYNDTGPTFVGLVEVNWTGPGGIWSPAKGKSSTFTAGATAGFYTLTGQNISLGVSDSFDVDITNWTVDFIKITDSPNGTELGTISLPIGGSITVYASGYNYTGSKYVGLVVINWTGAGGYWSFSKGKSSTYTAGTIGGLYIQTGENATLNISDTFEVNITKPTLDYIEITESPDGSPLGTVTVPLGGIVKAYASGYNITGPTYVGLIEVNWSGAGGIWSSGKGTNSTFTAGTSAGLYLQTAENTTLNVQDTFNVDIINATLDYIEITDSPNGTHLTTVILPIGGEVRAYASGYNYTGSTYVGLIVVNWTGSGGTWSPNISTNSRFIAGFIDGIYTQTGESSLGYFDTFDIEIIKAKLDYIDITDSPNGTPLNIVTLPIGGTVTAYASGYNYTGSTYLGLIEVNWVGSGGTWSPSTATNSTFTAGFVSGLYTLTGQNLTSNVFDTFNVNVQPPTLDFIEISETPFGAALDLVELPVGGKITLYVSGYNLTDPTYMSSVEVIWNQSTLLGSFSSSQGNSTTFTTGMSGGTATINCINSSLGLSTNITLIVKEPTVDYIQIRDTPGGFGNIVSIGIYSVFEKDEFYAAAYNNTAHYIYDVQVAWSSNNTNVGHVTSPGMWTNFTAQKINLDGICRVIATYGSASNSTGTLTVLAPRIDFIQIRDAPDGKGNITTTANFTIGELVTDTYFCAAYNHTVKYIGDRSVLWSITGGIGTVSPLYGPSTNFTAISTGSGIIIANLTGIINYTGIITVNPTDVPDLPPATPGNLTLEVLSSEKIKIDWSPNSESDLAGYIIQRSTDPNGLWYNVTITGKEWTSYTDTGLEPDTTYYYRIIAIDNASNESPPSEALSATTFKEEDFPWVWILIIIVIIVILILLFVVFRRRKPKEVPFEPEGEKGDLPLPPSWMLEKGEVTPPGKEEIPPEDEEIPEDELLLPEDREEEPPPPDVEIQEDELPPPEDE